MNDEVLTSSILSEVPDAILLTDAAGNFQYVCPNVEGIFQRTAAEVSSKMTINSLMGEFPFLESDLDHTDVLENVPWTITRPSGEKRFLKVHVKQVEIGNGTLLLSCRDVSEFERSLGHYRRFFDESLNIKVIIEFDGTIQHVNRRAIDILGKSLGEIRCTPAIEFVHPDDRGATIQELEKLAAGTQLLSFEHRIIDAKGDIRWISWTAWPDVEQELSFASGQDITDRKNAEQRLLLQHATTTALHEAKSREFIIDDLLRAMMGTFYGKHAECWLVDDNRVVLSTTVASSGCEFDLVSKQQEFSYGEGVPGLVWKTGDVVQLNELSQAKQFERKEWASQVDLGCVIGFPLKVENRVVGALLIFNERIQYIDAEMQETLLGIGQQIGQFFARQEAESDRAKTVALLQAIVESTTDAIFVKDTSGRYLICNEATAKFLGKSSDEIVGRNDHELLGMENAREIIDHDQSVIESGQAHTAEETFVAAGNLRTFLALKVPYRDMDGQTIGVIGISRDITERQKIKNELAEHRQKLAEALEIAQMGYWERKLDSDNVWWSDELYEIFGIDRNEFGNTYQAFLDCVRPSDRERVSQRISHAVQNRSHFEHQYRIAGGGEERVIFERGQLILDSFGKPSRIVGTAQDVTEQWQLRESLSEKEKELQLLAEAIGVASEGFLITDAQEPDNPIVFVSPGFERITGYSKREALGRNCRFLQGPATNREAVNRLRDAIQRAEPCTVEILNYRKDGSTFWNKISIAPLKDSTGNVTQFVGIQSDVTDRRQLEERFQQSQKLESIGQLAGGVAHDFNNLLTVIIGYCEVIVAEAPLDHPTRKYGEEVLKAGLRATELTDQLLAFSRKQMLQPTVVDVNALVRETTKMLKRLIGEQVQLNLALIGVILKVRIDATQFSQVLMNIAVNARDAMPKGGKLTIETQSVILAEDHVQGHDVLPGRYALIAITDTGEGMTKEVRERIFDPFFTTKTRGNGTGMGLATVFGIIKQSGGFINVYSEPGQGSCFKFYLPEVEDSVTDVDFKSGENSWEGTETILVVEDDESVREAASRFLERFGYKVYVAEDPSSAIKLNLDIGDEIDLLLTDVVMPQMNGRQLAETFLKLRPNLRILFMSGYTDGAIVEHGMLDTETNFIQKPFTAAELAQNVRRVLD